ncbi:MAG TPA: septum formation initiator family protein [Polyangiaceae bacterium]|jgi:cell division protein FtsB|nr:septum formation initiator family protein [Polyangiaceae bacterium]
MPARLLLERLLPITILIVAVVAVPTLIFSPSGLRRLDALRNEQREVDDQVSRLSKEIRRLRAEVSQVRDHLPAIERVARDELGLLRKTEVVFQFDP